MLDHAHDATVHTCPCGHRWDYVQTYTRADGTKVDLYTSKLVRDRYHALYGEPVGSPFVEVDWSVIDSGDGAYDMEGA